MIRPQTIMDNMRETLTIMALIAFILNHVHLMETVFRQYLVRLIYNPLRRFRLYLQELRDFIKAASKTVKLVYRLLALASRKLLDSRSVAFWHRGCVKLW